MVPRRDAEPLAGCGGATTTRRREFPYEELVARERARAAAPSRSTSCSTPASSTTTATGWSRSTYAKADPDRPLRCGSRVTNAGPEATAARAADAVVPQHLVVGRRHRRARMRSELRRPALARRPPRLGRPAASWRRGPDGAAPTLLFCDNETNAPRLFGAEPTHAVPEGRHQRPRACTARATRQPRRGGTKAAVLVPARRSPPGETVELRLRLWSAVATATPPTPSRRASFDAVMARRASGRPTSSTRDLLRPRDAADEAAVAAPGLRRDDLGQAVLPLRRARAGSTATPASRRRRRAARAAATPTGGTSTPTT